MLIGEDGLRILKECKIAVFGLGGVGSFAADALARCGVGKMDLFDGDVVDVTNINRQIMALDDTVGQPKTEVMKNRIAKINPGCEVSANHVFFDASNSENYGFSDYSYVVDAIDTISSKLLIINKAVKENVRIISSMGTGNKLNPCDLQVGDIYTTENCPLARVMRRELRKYGVKNLKVVFSKEKPRFTPTACGENGKRINASISFVPSVAGLIIASEVVKDILGI